MTDLVNRSLVVNVGGLRVTSPSDINDQPGLRVTFNVERNLSKEPNRATITIYNLSEGSRSQVQDEDLETTLEAGYEGNTHQLFAGQLDFSSHVKQGPDWVTTLQSGDGSVGFRQARISESIKGPASISTVVDALTNQLKKSGIEAGNIVEKVKSGTLRGSITEWTNGVSLFGRAEKELDKILRSLGFSWSVQDGQIQVLGPTETLIDEAILLSPGTGLVGSPEPGDKGVVRARSLLQPRLVPGKKTKIKSAEVDGFFKVLKVVFVGDTRGQDWYSDIEAQPL